MHKASPKTVWITRTLPSARDSALAFQNAGFTAIAEPLLRLSPVSNKEEVPPDSVLVFTAQNGVRAFAQVHKRRDYPVICVGGATAALAKRLGFEDVSSAGGTSDDIAPLIARRPRHGKTYLHISGEHVRGQVSEDIQELGLRAKRLIYYCSAPVPQMPKIDLAGLDLVTFFSPLAAKTLAGFAVDVAHISAISLSSAVDRALTGLDFKSRHIAAAPTLESLIAAARASD
jgi:uroporphyrinogen-III synthase